jgi:hypothetical protein
MVARVQAGATGTVIRAAPAEAEAPPGGQRFRCHHHRKSKAAGGGGPARGRGDVNFEKKGETNGN